MINQNPIFYETIGDLVQDQEYCTTDESLPESYTGKVNIIQETLKFGQDLISQQYYILTSVPERQPTGLIGKIYVRNTKTNLDGEYRLTDNSQIGNGNRFELTCPNCFNSEYWRLASCGFFDSDIERAKTTISFYNVDDVLLTEVKSPKIRPPGKYFVSGDIYIAEPNNARIAIFRSEQLNDFIRLSSYLSITHPDYGTTYYNFYDNNPELIISCRTSCSPPRIASTLTPSSSATLCTNLLSNGNFENGTSRPLNISPWTAENVDRTQLGSTIGVNNNYWVDLNACVCGYIEQNINTNI